MAAGRMLGGMPACRAAVRGSGPPSGACAAGAKAVGGASLGGGGDPSAASADHGQAAGARRLLPFRLRCAPPGCPPRVLPEMHAGEPAGGMRAAATAGIGGGIWAGRAAASRGMGARQSEAGLEGFEPSTAGLRVRCSTWLSHRPGTGCAGRYYKRCMRSGSGASGGPCAPRRPERPCNAPSGRQMGGRSKRPRRAAAYCRGPGTVGATRASSYLSSIELRTTETGTLFMRFFSAKSFW